MLISNIGDDKGTKGGDENATEDHSYDYQTASELLDMMSKNSSFDPSDADSLTAQDLILLYQNIDIGTKLLNDAKVKLQRPNQHVETVVYKDDQDSDSEFSESYSNEDLSNLIKTNQQRLDLFSNGSLENLLCQKLGGLKIQSPATSTPYNTQFMFQDPLLKSQLQSMNITTDSELNSLLPTSLLDYLCCKRLEDNYNFYLDNIIKYVQNTIDQLKRISNGDFLTDQAKEKWKEVNSEVNDNNITKVLANSTSIPLHVESKKKQNLTWDDIVHSEVDVRSLSKILEKKIVLEIPKMICGSYKFFSKRLADNFVISCKRENKKNEKEGEESRVDLVVQLQKLQTGQVMSNINSIMILQSTPSLKAASPEVLPLTYKNEVQDEINVNEQVQEVNHNPIEIIDHIAEQIKEEMNNKMVSSTGCDIDFMGYKSDKYIDQEFFEYNEVNNNILNSVEVNGDGDSTTKQPDVTKPGTFNVLKPDELRMTIQRLNMQSVLVEESNDDMQSQNTSKRRSPVRVRIKSPYENKSFLLEEKKRKKLLEIREKREKKKMALSENCKISKHKFAKSSVTPQASNSVTKLSITNKSFYNSIYGQNLVIDTTAHKNKPKKSNDLSVDIPVEEVHECDTPNLTPDKNGKKYINRSYYLDEAETEMMFTNIKDSKNNVANNCSVSTSSLSNEYKANFNYFSQFVRSSDTDFSTTTNEMPEEKLNVTRDSAQSKTSIPKAQIVVPDAVPTSSVECRKSIDKLYDLMRKSVKTNNTDVRLSKSRHQINTKHVASKCDVLGESSMQGSDSGTSLKHQLTMSNHSSFSFEKPPVDVEKPKPKPVIKKSDQVPSVVPKVIINAKLKMDSDKPKKGRERIRTTNPNPKLKTVPDNPLRTIAQLLHEFDNVQKTRQRSVPSGNGDNKSPKKPDVPPNEHKNTNAPRQQNARPRSRFDQYSKEETLVKVPSPKEKKTRSLDVPKVAPTEDKLPEKVVKNKIAEIIDEVKEARGEAVRGPPKNSRLYSLAQPKRIYVQAHSEEYQNRYGKNFMSHRLQKLAGVPPSPTERNIKSANSRNKAKRSGPEPVPKEAVKKPASPVPPLDKSWTFSNSPRKSIKSSYNKPNIPGISTSRRFMNVDSYVKNHYQNISNSFAPFNEMSLAGIKSRVPLLPKDLDIVSLSSSANGEANELGHRLHSMINTMVVKKSPLEVLSESQEVKSNDGLGNKSSDDQRTPDSMCDSDFKIDVMGDLNVKTAVQTINNTQNEKNSSNDNIDTEEKKDSDQGSPSPNSKTEMQNLENALYSQISGSFQKRLRIKNLTLTPKQSLQKAFILQSGDAGSLLVKSLSKIKLNQCDSNGFHKLNNMPLVANNHLKWDYMQVPMQITTVGYSITNQETKQNELTSGNVVTLCNKLPSVYNIATDNTDKILQCSSGVPQEITLKQTDIVFQPDKNVVQTVMTNLVDNIDTVEEPIVQQMTHEPIQVINVINNSDTDNNVEHQVVNAITKELSPDCTSSLDVLVGLLNEIQKITRQNQIVQSNSNLKMILNNTATIEEQKLDHQCMISIKSFGELKKIHSNSTVCSLCIPNNEGGTIVALSSGNSCNIETGKSTCEDKEVLVNIEKELVNTSTETPTAKIYHPITVSRSVNVSKSLIGILSEPSNQSVISFTDYRTLYFNKVFESKSISKIIELSQINKKQENKLDISKAVKVNSPVVNAENMQTVNTNRKVSRCLDNFDFDPLLKVKRDILVTMYSMLVLIVFAALSFPGLMVLEG